MKLGLLLLTLSAFLLGCANHPPGDKPVVGLMLPCRAHQGQWTSFDGTVLPYSCWPLHPPPHPQALVILAQGWDAVGADYESLGRALATAGYVVYSSENRTGINDPDGQRRGVSPKRWHDWVDDFKLFTAFAQTKHPGVPLFYHGHSMGSTVCMVAAAEASGSAMPRGLILHSPAMPFMSAQDRPVLEALLDSFGWVRVPHLRYDPATNGITGSTRLNSLWGWSEDRVRAGYSLSFYSAAITLGHQARLSSRSLKLPVLAMCGCKDSVVTSNDQEMQDYMGYLGTEIAGGQESAGGHTHLVIFQDGFHTLTEEPTRQRALHVMIDWLNALSRSGQPSYVINSRRTGTSPKSALPLSD